MKMSITFQRITKKIESENKKSWDMTRKEVLRIKGSLCCVCGFDTNLRRPDIEHNQPVCMGGSDEISNLKDK
jgi:5-methylcytosine-specific restriction endonuclease McrA